MTTGQFLSNAIDSQFENALKISICNFIFFLAKVEGIEYEYYVAFQQICLIPAQINEIFRGNDTKMFSLLHTCTIISNKRGKNVPRYA